MVPGQGGSAGAGHASALRRWAADRWLYVDNLKVVLIAAIIAGHAIAGYGRLEFWPYAEMREVTLSAVTETMLLAAVIPFGLFMIPLLFLVAGLLTPPSLERKGARAYVRDRLLRLGVPFAVFVGLLWPLLMYPVHPPGEEPSSYWAEFLRHGSIDTGVMWFAGVLLLLSLAYAAWSGARGRRAARPGQAGIEMRHLLMLTGAITAATFVVRLVLPYYSDNRYIDLNLYQWPECVALFALGVVASRAGWLTAVPDRLRRQSRAATTIAVAAFAVFVMFAANLGVVEDEVWGGWHWAALVFAALESTLAVYGSVWLLSVAQRRFDRRLRWAGPNVHRSAYGAFIVQGFILIGLAVGLRPVPVPAEIKAIAVASGAILGSFWIARMLNRVPGMTRIL